MPVKGFTSVTIHREHYSKIRRIADSKGMTIAQLVEYLIDQYERPNIRALMDQSATNGFTKVEWHWPGPYRDTVLDPNVKHYMSTAWVRTEDYISRAAGPLWAIDRRIREDESFRLERMFVISQGAWGVNPKERKKSKVWKWVSKWLSYRFPFEEKVKIFVVKEDDARNKRIDEQYYDMGIYGKQLVGFLKLDRKSNPQSYTWYALRKDIEAAVKNFLELKKCGKQLLEHEDLIELMKEDYN